MLGALVRFPEHLQSDCNNASLRSELNQAGAVTRANGYADGPNLRAPESRSFASDRVPRIPSRATRSRRSSATLALSRVVSHSPVERHWLGDALQVKLPDFVKAEPHRFHGADEVLADEDVIPRCL
jgi:hypothetical protein